MKLSPQQKEDKKARDALNSQLAHARSAWSFSKDKSLRTVLHALGLDDESIKQRNYYEHEVKHILTFHEVVDLLEDIRLSFEVELFLRDNPPQPDENYPSNSDQSNSIKEASSKDNDTILSEIPRDEEDTKEAAEELKDYGLVASPNEKCFLFWFQKKAAAQLLNGILGLDRPADLSISNHEFLSTSPKRGQYLLAGVGTGKTFIIGAVFRRLVDMQFATGKSFTPFPYIYVTKASIVEQTRRALHKWFGLTDNEVVVTNYDQLRSKFGEMFIKEETYVENGVEHVNFVWRKGTNPVVIVWDEGHSLKNEDSTQSRIGQSFNNIPTDHTYQIFSSATPGVRVTDFKCFAVATHLPINFGIAKNVALTNDMWPSWSKQIADPAEVFEHSPAAVDRIVSALDKYIVRVKGVKAQFNPVNSIKMIDFETAEERIYYEKAFERYLAEKAKLGEVGGMAILVEFLKFRQAAELCRAKHLAKLMYHGVREGFASCAALNFKNTITKVVRHLIEDYDVKRSEISLIWGGAAVQTTKQKAKKQILDNDKLKELLEEEGLDLESLGLEQVEAMPEFATELPVEYRLGNQSIKQRQVEIDRFQSGKSLYCLYTFRAGGVGLSLHHTDEFCTDWDRTQEDFEKFYREIQEWNEKYPDKKCLPGKVRRKNSGYAFEDDIRFIPTRPRINFVTPTYSPVELVQGLGRCPRLTSLSNTPQQLLFYRGTIERVVANIVSIKLRCLSKVVRQREAWNDVIVGGNKEQEEAAEEHINRTDKLLAGAESDETNNPFMSDNDSDDEESSHTE